MSLEGATVLVTGGAGFIGSHLVDDLVAQGARVRVYDNLSFGSLENLRHLEGRIELIQGDVLDEEQLLEAMAGVDLVSHQAAQLEIFRAKDDPVSDLTINTVGTLYVLRAAARAGVKRVVNASSACVYGQYSGPVTEEALPVPNWAYGVSKLAAERYGHIYHQDHRLDVVNLRYGIVYGEREWYRRALTIFVKRALEGHPPVVFGNGSQVRDFIHVADVVRMHRLCLTELTAAGQTYNVGTGMAMTIRDLAQTVVRVSGSALEVQFEEVPEGAHSRLVPQKRRNPAELRWMQLDCGKAFRELGWRPEVPLEEGLRRQMEWVRANPHRWSEIRYTPVGSVLGRAA